MWNNDENNSNDSTVALGPFYLHFLAQNLNNQGCAWIAKGDFDQAIEHLKDALELTRIGQSNEKGAQKPCSCKYCRIGSFIKTTDENGDLNNEVVFDDRESPKCSSALKRKRPGTSINGCSSRMDIDSENNHKCLSFVRQQDKRTATTKGRDEESFIYHRPLLVSKESIDGCHYIGTTLSFIVLFNIALAHHLKAIEILPFLSDPNETVAALQQPLKLYELAYQLYFQSQENKQSQGTPQKPADKNSNDHNVVNLRFMMLITNNISQIHKLAGNDKKYYQCLEHLLNALMYMSHNNAFQSKDIVLTTSEKDGIFDNLSPILNTKNYAAAA